MSMLKCMNTSPAAAGKRPLGLYLHIPFCKRKCLYCDFLSAPAPKEQIAAYVDALCMQIAGEGRRLQAAGSDSVGVADTAVLSGSRQTGRPETPYCVQTIFFGGGTPSLLTGKQMKHIMETIRQAFYVDKEAEITMECNPGTLTAEKLTAYRAAGVNRLSIGLQSADDKELAALGRIHTWEEFLENYRAAQAAGFTNINVDLMSALPGQTLEGWLCTLRKVAALAPAHISAYSLIVEEGTPFYDWYGEEASGTTACSPLGKSAILPLPDEDVERLMYEKTREVLAEYGYERYEISNYAKPGKACRHNVGYWLRTDYLGLGLGASSLLDSRRFKMEEELSAYLQLCQAGEWQRLYREETVLTRREQMEEFMFLGLRLTAGIEVEKFYRQFGVSLEEIYGKVIEKNIARGLLQYDSAKKQLYLTQKGVDVSNYVLAQFLG